MEKFEIDIKWGSYLFIANVVASIVISLLVLLIGYHSLRYLSYVFMLTFVIQLFYFTSRAIKERNDRGVFRNLFVFVRIFAFSFSLITMLVVSKKKPDNFMMTICIRKESSDLLQDDSYEYNGITLNEFMATLKRKFSRS
ncbi:hypothetical protein [Flavobacterium sharifuzzamanii]|uniref:hypothetical protein n=1 Tax=Flavobacterium sharifuzzamanii TaxID=2211133 RepID=UPI000DAE365C|nr:hypothetical protein [Flavobacterium sharifuzzamanii]KAF2080515.1 hypothetical protein DMA14_14560 [Flavobacterium sharifuzzamanii]